MDSSVATAGKDKGWAQLTEEERGAAAELGYDEALWDAGETTSACLQPWRELLRKPRQRAAAQQLGYTQADWDAELMAGAELMDAQPGLSGVDGNYEAAATADFACSVPATYNSISLFLSDKSGTGYKGVCQRGENRFAVTYKGKCEGSYSTAIEAAARYAEIIEVVGGEEELPTAKLSAANPASDKPAGAKRSEPPALQPLPARAHERRAKQSPPPPPQQQQKMSTAKVTSPRASAGASSTVNVPRDPSGNVLVTKSCGIKLHLSPGSVCERSCLYCHAAALM